MSLPFVDTNVLIRLLTRDNPHHSAAARAFWMHVERGELTVAAPAVVIAETVYVLASPRLYRLPRDEIAALLRPLVRLPHFHLENGREILTALDLYASTNLTFGDAQIAAAMHHSGVSQIYSFDTDFDRLPGVIRVEPS